MTVGSHLVSCTGHAISIRRGDAIPDLGNVLRGASRGGATILIVGPSFWSAPARVIPLIARCGFRVVISAEFNHKAYDNLIKAGILAVCLAPVTMAKVQDTVESDPGIVLSVDVAGGELRARGERLARFAISLPGGPRATAPAGNNDNESDSRARGGEAMAGRLLMAQRLLGSASLSGDVRMRLQRRLVAICDAIKTPGADALRCARRLDRLLSDLARTGQAGLAQAPDSRAQPPASAAHARELGPGGGGTRGPAQTADSPFP